MPEPTIDYVPVTSDTSIPETPTERSTASPGEAAGKRIGPYTLVRLLGQGGMGAVWLAEQSEPVKRQVALKLIRAGLNVGEVIERFAAERQALALMNHPNIAKIYDAGTAPAGQPYFAMELVDGVPLSAYCDRERLSIRERLELFLPICRAVQHAHQKGLIHRDLKPSNILVAVHDGKPVPKVIDFGIAKATGPEITGETLHTAAGELIGTPEYMAPEQADPGNADIDTRVDVYALGVILYELLAGSPPFSRRQTGISLFELLRRIREEEPVKPSTKLSIVPELHSLAAARKSDPKRLTNVVRGDLDWIVMRCLEKDRGRRYETANGLARDIERYLVDEPVTAGPPSRGYRFKKFVRRNKGPVIAASLVFFALLAGIVGTTLGMVRANEANETTKRRLTQIENGVGLFAEMLHGINPRSEEFGGPTVYQQLRERAEKTADELDAEAVGDPLAVARLQANLGNTLRELGNSSKAIVMLEKARATQLQLLGTNHHDTLTSTSRLGEAYGSAGQLDKALPLLQEALQQRKAKLGAEHPDTLGSMSDLAMGYHLDGQREKARQLMEETLRLRKAKLGADHPDTLTSINNLANAYRSAGQLENALPLFEEALPLMKTKLGASHPDTIQCMNGLAAAFYSTGQLEEALPLWEETLRHFRTKLGADHPNTLTSMNNLAAGYRSTGQIEKALPLFEEALPLMKTKLGPDHPDTLTSMNNLAAGYRSAGQIEKALPLFDEALRLMKVKLGAGHPDLLASMNNLAEAQYAAGHLDKALPLYEETLQLMKVKLGADHEQTLACMNNLALAYHSAGQLDKALPLYEETLRLKKTSLGANHPDTITSMASMARALHQVKRSTEASKLFEDTLARIEARRFRHEHTGPIIGAAVTCFEQSGDLEKAESWRRKWLVQVKEKSGPESLAYATELAGLGGNLIQQQKYSDAEAALSESLAIRERKAPEAWTTFNTKSVLGAAFAGQKKFAEAEPLLLKGYEGMKAREKSVPPQAGARIPEAIDRLIELYTVTNKPDEVKKWQAERATYPQTKKEPDKK